MNLNDFRAAITQGIPATLPQLLPFDPDVNHAPVRKDILSASDKKLAIRNALRYFDARHHEVLAVEFAEELNKFGRIYMYRFRPQYAMHARPIDQYPAQLHTGSCHYADDSE